MSFYRQYKIVCRPKGTRDFHWRQDCRNWHDLDGMPATRVRKIDVYCDPETKFNGPLAFIPGSLSANASPRSRSSPQVRYVKMPRDIAHLNLWGASAGMQGSVAVTAEVSRRPYRTRAAFTGTWVCVRQQWHMAAWQTTALPSP